MKRPQLRSDLIFSRQETAGATFHVVKDPATGRFFRFGSVEHTILLRLALSPDPETIARGIAAEIGASVSPEVVRRFVDKVHRLGLLEEAGTSISRLPRRGGRVRGNPLYLRIKLFDPDRMFGVIARRAGFVYTPWFLMVCAAAVALAACVALERRGEFLQDLLRQLRPQVFLFAWLTVFAVTVLHESAHGVTCKRFGGEVHEVGAMLIYLQLAFYCNVSDAWLFPQKSRRLWVTFSGACFELFIWALATLTWRVTEADSPAHLAGLVVMATSGIKNMFNLNPLIKLDGYYLLSDSLEIPNLRVRAFEYMRDRIGRLRGRSGAGPVDLTRRERRILAWYGLLAGLFSFSMLGIVLIHVGKRLVDRYQVAGLLLFAGVMAILARNPVRRILAGPLARLKGASGGGGWRKRPAAAVLLFALILAGTLFGRLEIEVSGDFTILPSQNADIRALIDGVVEEIPVSEGERVETGDLIARLSDREWRAELAKTEAEIQERRATLRVLREKSIGARTTVEKNDERLKYGRTAYGRVRTLGAQGLASAREVDDAAEQVAVRRKELEEARAGLNAAGGEIEADEAAVVRLEAQRAYLEEQIRLARLATPHPGIVCTPRVKEMIGRYVEKGTLIAEVHELTTVNAEIEVPEKEIADVRVGQPVLLKARALPARTFSGTVSAIAPVVAPAEGQDWLKVVRVSTTLQNGDGLLKSKMTGTAKIQCGRTRILDLVTRRLALYLKVEFWSWW